MLTLKRENGTKGMGNNLGTVHIIDGYCLHTLSITVTTQKMVSAVWVRTWHLLRIQITPYWLTRLDDCDWFSRHGPGRFSLPLRMGGAIPPRFNVNVWSYTSVILCGNAWEPYLYSPHILWWNAPEAQGQLWFYLLRTFLVGEIRRPKLFKLII